MASTIQRQQLMPGDHVGEYLTGLRERCAWPRSSPPVSRAWIIPYFRTSLLSTSASAAPRHGVGSIRIKSMALLPDAVGWRCTIVWWACLTAVEPYTGLAKNASHESKSVPFGACNSTTETSPRAGKVATCFSYYKVEESAIKAEGRKRLRFGPFSHSLAIDNFGENCNLVSSF
jgi:hypothetical protein